MKFPAPGRFPVTFGFTEVVQVKVLEGTCERHWTEVTPPEHTTGAGGLK